MTQHMHAKFVWYACLRTDVNALCFLLCFFYIASDSVASPQLFVLKVIVQNMRNFTAVEKNMGHPLDEIRR
jgi:hypothetical protein